MSITRTFLVAVAIAVLSAGCATDGKPLMNPRHIRPLSHKLSVATYPYWQTTGETIGQKVELLTQVIADDFVMNTD